MADIYPVKITASGNGRVEIAGQDISGAISGLTLDMVAGDLAVLTLRLPIYEAGDVEGEAAVVIPDETKDLLVAHGWTPPGVVDVTPVGSGSRRYQMAGG